MRIVVQTSFQSRFTFQDPGSNIGTFTIQSATNFEYFEVGNARTQPLYKVEDGQLILQDGYIHDITLEECSLIEISGQSSPPNAAVEIKRCRFERISLHKATDFDPDDSSIQPTQCCAIQIKITNTSTFNSHQYLL
ncbi:MAG: hypothetical protein EZS28_054809, partial [Streblomastix strix]